MTHSEKKMFFGIKVLHQSQRGYDAGRAQRARPAPKVTATTSDYFAPHVSLRSVVSVPNKSIYVSFYIAGLPDREPAKSLLDRMSAVEKETNKILTLLGDPSAGKL